MHITQSAGVTKPERSGGFGIPLAGLVMRFFLHDLELILQSPC